MNNLYLYFLFIPIIIYCFITTPIKNIEPIELYYKTLLVYVAMFFIAFSMLKDNTLVNKYIFPFLLFINIAIIPYITLINKYDYINLLPLIGIMYLLYTFNYKDFRLKKGKLVNPNKKWIIMHIILLSFYYLLMNKIIRQKSVLWSILLIIFPLFFPINEYFIHRTFSLALAFSLNWKYFYNVKLI